MQVLTVHESTWLPCLWAAPQNSQSSIMLEMTLAVTLLNIELQKNLTEASHPSFSMDVHALSVNIDG